MPPPRVSTEDALAAFDAAPEEAEARDAFEGAPDEADPAVARTESGRRSRVLVLPEREVSTSRSTGESIETMRGAPRVEYGDAVDPGGKGPRGGGLSREQRLAALAGALRGDAGARELLGQAAEQEMSATVLGQRDAGEAPQAPIVGRDRRGMGAATGAAQGLTSGYADELRGAVRSGGGVSEPVRARAREVLSSPMLQPLTSVPIAGPLLGAAATWAGTRSDEDVSAYERERDRARDETRAAREQEPGAYLGGELVGGAAQGALIPGTGATTALGRIGGAALSGAAQGAVSGLGHSEAEDAEGMLADAGTGAAVGGVMGGGLAAGGEGLAAGGRELARRVASGRDRALFAATGGGSGSTAAVRALQDLPESSQAAERIRQMGLVPRVGTVGQIAERAAAARSGAGERLGRVFSEMEGVTVPTYDVVGQLDNAGVRFSDPGWRDAQAVIRAMADDIAESYPEGVPFDRLQRMIEGVRAQGAYQPVRGGAPMPVRREAQQEINRVLRSIMDDMVEAQGGSGAGGAYRAARLDSQVARTVEQNAQDALARQASNRSFGIMEMMAAGAGGTAGTVGGGPLGGMGGALVAAGGARALRAVEGTLRATVGEAAFQALQRVQRAGPLPQWARTIMGAAQRGTQAATAAHFVLSQTDPEYRAALAQESTDERAAGE